MFLFNSILYANFEYKYNNISLEMIRRTNSIELPGNEYSVEKNTTMNELREYETDNQR